MNLNIDRMGPEERRRREMDSEATNDSVVKTMIEEENSYNVQSFTVDGRSNQITYFYFQIVPKKKNKVSQIYL